MKRTVLMINEGKKDERKLKESWITQIYLNCGKKKKKGEVLVTTQKSSFDAGLFLVHILFAFFFFKKRWNVYERQTIIFSLTDKNSHWSCYFLVFFFLVFFVWREPHNLWNFRKFAVRPEYGVSFFFSFLLSFFLSPFFLYFFPRKLPEFTN